MITREQLVSSLDKWAEQDHYPVAKFIDDTGCVCPLGMIARECMGTTDEELASGVIRRINHGRMSVHINHGRMSVMDQLKLQLGESLCLHIEEANDSYLSSGSNPLKVVDYILDRYEDIDEETTMKGESLRYVREITGMTAEEFAKVLGISRTTLWRWETSLVPIPDSTHRFCDALLRMSMSPDEGEFVETVRQVISMPSLLS